MNYEQQGQNTRIVIGAIVIVVFVILVIGQVHQFNTADCSEMLDWAVKNVPARCLKELSGGK